MNLNLNILHYYVITFMLSLAFFFFFNFHVSFQIQTVPFIRTAVNSGYTFPGPPPTPAPVQVGYNLGVSYPPKHLWQTFIIYIMHNGK